MRKLNRLPVRLLNYEKTLPPHKEYVERAYKVGEDGFAVIAVNSYEGLEWYDPLSCGGQRNLNREIFEYIDTQAYIVPVEYPLRIEVMNCRLDESECEKVSLLIKEHYARLHWESLINIRKNRMASVALTVLGALFIMFAITMQSVDVNKVFSEMSMIVATFTFWEAASHWMMTGAELKLKRLCSGQLAMADVVFRR